MPSSAGKAPSAASTNTEPVDLTSTPYSLQRAVYARKSEYVRPHRVRVKVGTWNVAACPGTDKDLASWFIAGKGIDKRLANLDISTNTAVERQDTADSLDDDPNAVRLIGGDKIGLYVLGLQEVVDLNVANQYISRVYADTGPTALERWRTAIESALPEGYERIAAEQMSGLLLLIYASPEIAPTVSNISTSFVGTGLLGLLGNKGSVATRIVLGETTRLVFINSHLASGNESSYLERRCWDVNQIMSRTQFAPVSHAGVEEELDSEKIGDEDFVFWFGDLNFRLDGLPGDDIRRLLTLHTRGEYGVVKTVGDGPIDGEDPILLKSSESGDKKADQYSLSITKTDSAVQGIDDDDDSSYLPDPDEFVPDASEDPASLQATLDSLLTHDQLLRLMREGKVFQDGWREGRITFLPSYKYDVGTVGLFDSSEKKRPPSWCDRILFRTRRDKEEYERKIREQEEAKKKDEDMKARGLDHAADDDDVLFDYDPDRDADEQPLPSVYDNSVDDYDEFEDDAGGELQRVMTKDGYMDRIRLDIYTSHQRIQSSDHKPIISVFTLDYDAVAPELKAKVHSEVARELDRAENEGRPGITIVVDGQDSTSGKSRDPHSDEAVDFGQIEYLRKTSRSLTLANTGRVPATFSFVEKPSTEETEGSSPPQWLTTSFVRPDPGAEDGGETVDLGKEVTLEPGETVSCLLEVLIDDLAHVRMLNDGQCALEDVLVLRVTDGRDHFIPARGTWSPTCIGRSIDELIRVPDGGIRPFLTALSKERKKVIGSIPYELDVHHAAPKELFKLTEAVESLTERVIADEQMLNDHKIPRDKAGWPFEDLTCELDTARVARVIDALDDDKPIHDAFEAEVSSVTRLEVVSHVLLLFLRGLTDGIITIPLWGRIDQASLPSLQGGSSGAPPSTPGRSNTIEDDKTAVLDTLASAPNHNISFVFLTTTLARIVSELSPLSPGELEALRISAATGTATTRGGGLGSLGRRSLNFRRSGGPAAAAVADALAALERRQARERRYADVFSRAICRAPVPGPAKEKDRRALEEKQRAVVEIFLRRARDEMP